MGDLNELLSEYPLKIHIKMYTFFKYKIVECEQLQEFL